MIGKTRMDLETRLGVHVDQAADAARLRAGEILADDAADGEVDREFSVDRVAALAPVRHIEAAFAVGEEGDTVFDEHRSTGMFRAGTRPEHTHLPVDFFVGDAVVIGHAAARGFAQLIENVAGRGVWEKLAFAETAREVADDR